MTVEQLIQILKENYPQYVNNKYVDLIIDENDVNYNGVNKKIITLHYIYPSSVYKFKYEEWKNHALLSLEEGEFLGNKFIYTDVFKNEDISHIAFKNTSY